MDRLEVIASFDWLEKEETIGYLEHDTLRGADIYSFEYSTKWVKDHPNVILGKDLEMFYGKQYSGNNEIFGCFADCLPDHWGRTLIQLKKKQSAGEHGRMQINLSDWEYLKGVEDSLRTGGFRFKDPLTGEYLNVSGENEVPPVLSLDELFEAAHEIEKNELENKAIDNRWVERLLKPGSSVGGARPKACVTDETGLYIAKFPCSTDYYNVEKWEYFANKMAEQCGIHTTPTRLVKLKSGHDVFLSKRFDRTADGRRIHMSSALNLLGLTLKNRNDVRHSYSEIAELIIAHGTNVENSLRELYRRVAFSIIIGNSDDHLKNHSFLLTKKGWELSPVYDINPSSYHTHCLLIDEASDESSLDRLYKAHEIYMLDEKTAFGIIREMTHSFKYWEQTALKCDISKEEMSVFRDRIEEGLQW